MPESSLRAAEELGTSCMVSMSTSTAILVVAVAGMACGLTEEREHNEQQLKIGILGGYIGWCREEKKEGDGWQ